MSHYHNFIGIDMGKFSFVVAKFGSKTTHEYENTSAGIALFIEEFHDVLLSSFCVVETTGGYELALLYTMLEANYAVHRADTRKVKNFIRSYGCAVKTDALDAKALAVYGKERVETLDIFKPKTACDIKLFQLVQHRMDIKQMLVAEKNRKQSPCSSFVRNSISKIISTLEVQILETTEEIKAIIASNPELKAKQDILKTIPGIGDVLAFELLILLPELGTLSRRKIASLAGVAPRNNDSGKFNGYRRTGHGRNGVKPLLFLAAMAARNSNTHLKEFYEKLISKGKKKMVALTALMRKILIIANARLKSFDHA